MHSVKSISAALVALAACAAFVGCETTGIDVGGNTNSNSNSNTNTNGNDNGTDFELLPQSYGLSPDDFADDTDLTDESPQVKLYTAGDDNEIFTLFEVTASEDGQGYAPSGTKVFGHAGIPFFNNVRRLYMDFESAASEVSITFGGGSLSPEIGRLEVYSSSNVLLDSYVTQPLVGGQNEVMTVTRPSADISWAIAYIADGEGSFGRMDDLNYTVNVLTAVAKPKP